MSGFGPFPDCPVFSKNFKKLPFRDQGPLPESGRSRGELRRNIAFIAPASGKLCLVVHVKKFCARRLYAGSSGPRERLVHFCILVSFRYQYREALLVNMVSKRYHFRMIDDATDSEDIAQLLIYLGRAARGTDAGSDLTAAQWMAMRFFARANHFSRTPSAFASFHATTRGTASQTIKSLMLKGYLVRHEAADDRRSVRLDLTSSGKSIMRHDPLCKLTDAIYRLEGRLRMALRQALPALAGELAKTRDTVAFGTCGDCRHFSCCGAVSFCACVGAELAPADLGCLCVNFAASERRKAPMHNSKLREIS